MARPIALGEKGFTLAEAVIVIVITGILFAAVAIFIQRPVRGYFDTVRRAQLVDIADTALQRISRDVRMALPNSVRIANSGGRNYLEFLLTSGGGRYRADGPGSNVIVAGTPTLTFDVFGPMPTFSGGESIVVFNLFSDPAATSANAYVGDNRAAYSSNNGTAITLTLAKTFPFDSPAHRFQVVQYPVTYECDPVGGVLRRYWGYAIAASQATPPVTVNQALLANNVSACLFSYAAGATQRSAVLVTSVSLTLVDLVGADTVNLFKQVHVNNVP